MYKRHGRPHGHLLVTKINKRFPELIYGSGNYDRRRGHGDDRRIRPVRGGPRHVSLKKITHRPAL